MEVSLYSDATTLAHQEEEIGEVIKYIQTDTTIAERIAKLRTLDKSQYDQQKKCLPAVTWACELGEGRKYESLVKYNNLMVIDIDHLENAEATKALIREPWISHIFTSPSGHGLKILVAFKDTNGLIEAWNQGLADKTIVPAKGDWLTDYHRTQYESIKKHFKDKYNLDTDDSGKDVNRLCFLSSDALLYTNTALVPREPEEVPKKKEKEVSAIITPASATLLVEKPKINSKKKEKDAEDEQWTLKQCEWHLDLIPCGEGGHDKWIKIGWSLYHAYKDEALPVFVKWSKANLRTEEDCLKKVWSFAKDNLSEPLTLDTIKFYYNEALEAWYNNNIYNDTKRQGELYTKFLSLTTQDYLVLMIDGYKRASKRDTIAAIEKYLLTKHLEPRERAVEYIVDHLYLVNDAYPYVSVLPAGRHNLGGENFLVERSHAQVTPVKGEWTNIKYLIETTMPEKDYQWLYSWLQHALLGYMSRDMTNKGQAVLLIGEAQCGKSTIAKILTRLLGGYAASVAKIVMKDIRFDREMLVYPVWSIDDTLGRQGGTSVNTIHGKLRELIKMSTVQSPLSFEAKNKCPVNIGEIYRRLIIALNNAEDTMALVPTSSNDIEDKYSLLTCTHYFVKDSFDENLLWRELPAFAYYILTEWQKPTWIETNTRMSIVHYHNEVVAKYIYNSSPEKKLLDDIESIMLDGQRSSVEGSATEIYNILYRIASSHSLGNRPMRFTSANHLGASLGALTNYAPTVVKQLPRSHGGNRGWSINFGNKFTPSKSGVRLYTPTPEELLVAKMKNEPTETF